MIKTFQLLEPKDVAYLKDKLYGLQWIDGKATAKSEYLNKRNNQILLEEQATEIVDWLRIKLFDNEYFRALIRPKHLIRPMMNKYSQGEYYDWHYDAPTMGEKRGDLSFTLFLEPSDSYEGGELQLLDGEKTVQAKLEPGEIIVYTTGHRHRVCEVTRGTRVAVVGWIESWVKEDQVRFDLMTLAKVIGRTRLEQKLSGEELSELVEVYNNIIRRESR